MEELGRTGLLDAAKPADTDLRLVINAPSPGALSIQAGSGAGEADYVIDADAPEMAGRAILAELVPQFGAHAEKFVGNVFLLSIEGVRRFWPERADAVMERLRGWLKPHAHVLAGANGSQFWIASGLLLVVCTKNGAHRAPRFREDIRRAAHKLLGDDGETTIECYTLCSAEAGCLVFRRLVEQAAAPNAGGEAAPDRRPADMLSMILLSGDSVTQDDAPSEWNFATRKLVFRPSASRLSEAGEETLEFETVYLPVWDVRHEVIASSVAVPARMVKGRLLVGTRSIPSVCFGDGLVTDIFVDQLMHVSLGLEVMRESGGAGFVSFALPHAAVRSPRRLAQMASALGQLPAEQRRHLLLTIWDIPPDATEGRLRDLVQTLRRHCFNLTLAYSGTEGNWRTAFELDAAVVCLQPLATLSGDEQSAAFAAECRHHRRRSFVGLVESREVVEHLIAAEIDFVAGPALGEPMSYPAPAQIYYREDFRNRRRIE